MRKKNQIKILIGDCDSKLHNEKLADLFWEQGIFLWPRAGKDDAAKLMKKKKNKSMFNWKCALEEAQKKCRWGDGKSLLTISQKS